MDQSIVRLQQLFSCLSQGKRGNKEKERDCSSVIRAEVD